jgi:hypothetical protein
MDHGKRQFLPASAAVVVSIGPNDPTVRMPVIDLCVRCQHELGYSDLDLESTVELERLPALLRRQAE